MSRAEGPWQLLERLSALDAGAESAVPGQLLSYFDARVEGRTGLDAYVRAAAVLTGRAA